MVYFVGNWFQQGRRRIQRLGWCLGTEYSHEWEILHFWSSKNQIPGSMKPVRNLSLGVKLGVLTIQIREKKRKICLILQNSETLKGGNDLPATLQISGDQWYVGWYLTHIFLYIDMAYNYHICTVYCTYRLQNIFYLILYIIHVICPWDDHHLSRLDHANPWDHGWRCWKTET